MMENNMSYEEFKEYFREQLKNTLGECIEIQEQKSESTPLETGE